MLLFNLQFALLFADVAADAPKELNLQFAVLFADMAADASGGWGFEGDWEEVV